MAWRLGCRRPSRYFSSTTSSPLPAHPAPLHLNKQSRHFIYFKWEVIVAVCFGSLVLFINRHMSNTKRFIVFWWIHFLSHLYYNLIVISDAVKGYHFVLQPSSSLGLFLSSLAPTSWLDHREYYLWKRVSNRKSFYSSSYFNSQFFCVATAIPTFEKKCDYPL